MIFRLFLTSLFPLVGHFSLAAQSGGTQRMAVSQGISSPSMTSTVHFTTGYTVENPVGVSYQDKIRVTAQMDTGDRSGSDSNGYGGEVGIGNGRFGFAAGFYDACDTCDGRASAMAAAQFSSIGVGLQFNEDFSSAGLLINPTGQHRFGFVATLFDGSLTGSRVSAFGAGYSYVDDQFTFAIDASKNEVEGSVINDDTIMITPGFSFRINGFAFTASYDMYVNEPNGSSLDNDLWFGVGYGKENWHLALYADYINDLTFNVSFFF